MPKPKKTFSVEQAEALAARGLTNEKIADALGIGQTTFYRRKKEMEELEGALSRARARGEAKATDMLVEMFSSKYPEDYKEKDLRGEYVYPPQVRLKALSFFLERRCGWTAHEKLDVTSSDRSMTPVSVDLGNRSLDEIMDLVDRMPKDADDEPSRADG